MSYLPEMIFFCYQIFSWCQDRNIDPYVKSTLQNRPERLIIYCGTNDMKNNRLQSIADNILSSAKSRQQRNIVVQVSSLVSRKDHLGKKCKAVSNIFKKKCNEMNLAFISQGNIRTQ